VAGHGGAVTEIVLVPGLLGTPELYAAQLPALWRFGPVLVADHRRDDSMAAIARRLLASAPPRFTLIGLSMGGYLAFEVLRQAPERVRRLALLDTTARADGPDHLRRRARDIAEVRAGKFETVAVELFRRWVRPAAWGDAALRARVLRMARHTGPEAFLRQSVAIMHRPDSRPDLPGIACPTLILVGAEDAVTTPEHAAEIAAGIPGARHVVVPACGHLSTVEQCRRVLRDPAAHRAAIDRDSAYERLAASWLPLRRRRSSPRRPRRSGRSTTRRPAAA
jgi:pimeloyl-ACP methyl ester carboxylesterase